MKGAWGNGGPGIGGRVPGLPSVSNSFHRTLSLRIQAPPPEGPRNPKDPQNPCSLEISESRHQDLLPEDSKFLFSRFPIAKLETPIEPVRTTPRSSPGGGTPGEGMEDRRGGLAGFLGTVPAKFQLLQSHSGKLISRALREVQAHSDSKRAPPRSKSPSPSFHCPT